MLHGWMKMADRGSQLRKLLKSLPQAVTMHSLSVRRAAEKVCLPKECPPFFLRLLSANHSKLPTFTPYPVCSTAKLHLSPNVLSAHRITLFLRQVLQAAAVFLVLAKSPWLTTVCCFWTSLLNSTSVLSKLCVSRLKTVRSLFPVLQVR